MASIRSLPLIAIVSAAMPILFFIALPPTALSQDPMTPTPALADCTSRLLTLSPCAPFVQGMVQAPVQPCCDNLRQLYSLQPGCICILLNNSAFTVFPINRTLALELPSLCSLEVDVSACSGVSMPPGSSSSSSTPPGSQVSLGAKANSSVAASPEVQVAPRPNIMGFGFGRNAGAQLRTEESSTRVASATLISALYLLLI